MTAFAALSVVGSFALAGLTCSAVQAADSPPAKPVSAAVPKGFARVQRTWMPDASPSSFAVGLPNGLNVCFDPERGQALYAWRGTFVDMKPTLEMKFPRETAILGNVVWRAPKPAFARPGGAAAKIRFRGYSLGLGSVEFRWDADTSRVALTLTADASGRAIHCRYRVEPGGTGLAFCPSSATSVAVEEGEPMWVSGALVLSGSRPIAYSETLNLP